ncbi:hypothetical protein QMT04_20165, partial [Cronobacter sakazakii]|nr:hypothetical protein [Cronobacter sakazakii]
SASTSCQYCRHAPKESASPPADTSSTHHQTITSTTPQISHALKRNTSHCERSLLWVMGMYWEGIKRVTVALFNGFIFVIAGGEKTIKNAPLWRA